MDVIHIKSQSIRTSLEVHYDVLFFFYHKTVYIDDISIFCCAEMLWTFTANIRLHTFMTKYM